MTTNFLYAQAPNRTGNKSKNPPQSNVGVTAVTRGGVNVARPSGSQGPASASGSATGGRSQKVQVNRPKADYCANDGYRSSSFLK